MKQVKRALAILLAIVMIVAVFPASVLASPAEAESYPYDGEGEAFIAWKKLSTATGYRISIYLDTVSDATLLTTENFGANVTSMDATELIKQNGPGMYVAILEALRGSTVRKTITSDLMVIQKAPDVAPTVVIGEEAATVSWEAVEGADLGYKVVATLTDKDSGEVVATEEYTTEETTLDVTDFVKEYADNETALELSATVSILGDLTIREEAIDGTTYKVCYLNSEPSEPGVAENLVGILPLGVITSTEVDAEPGDPGKLTVNYKLEGGAVDYTYVKQLKLVLSCSDGEDVTTKTFTVDEVAVEGTIDVSKLIGSPGDYDWKVTLLPKYVGNAETENEGETPVNYTVYELPAPELTVADDASTISWPAVVASDEVENPTTFDDDARYKIEISTDGNNWSEITGGAITKETDEEDNVTFVVDISDKIPEGEAKNFKVTLLNTKDNSTYDPRFKGESFATVEVYKTIQPTDVAFDVETGAYDNPPEKDDQVFLTWTEPTSTEGIDHYFVTIIASAAEVDEEGNPVLDEEGNAVTSKTEVTFETDGLVTSVDVSEYIDAENVADYTATVQSIGKHANEDYSHFDADSGITGECTAVTSGAVATAKEAAKIEQQDDVLVLVVDLDNVNDNFDKVESVWLSDFTNGEITYSKSIEGTLDTDAATATFDLSGYYTPMDLPRLPSGDWSGTVSVYSLNNALNADTEATVKASYKPYQLQILGEELLDEEGNPTGEVGEPLVVNLETGEVTWAPAYAYDEANEKIEDSEADYYKVKLEYLDGSVWKGVKVVGGDDTNEWEEITDTKYSIADGDALDGVGMVPGRVYRVNVQAFSDRPLEYTESDVESTKLSKFPAVVAAITADEDYPAGKLSWTSDYTYPTGTEYQIDAGDYSDKATESPYALYELLEEYGEYDATVTVLGIVADEINYVQSDVSNAVTAYRGVVPAVDIADDSVEFAIAAGGVMNLSFALPTTGADAYEQAMIDAIDPTKTIVRVYSIDPETGDEYQFLGEYADEDGDCVVDATYANKTTVPDTPLENLNLEGGVIVKILLGSKTEYVDDYVDYEAGVEAAADSVKVVSPVEVPVRPEIDLEGVTVDHETGIVTIPAVTDADEDASITYTATIEVGDGTYKRTLTPVTDEEGNVTGYTFPTDDKMTGGDEAIITITATDANGKYKDTKATLNAYKLTDPVIEAINKNTGLLTFTSRDEKTVEDRVTFSPEGAEFNPETKKVKFDLTVDPAVVVTTTVASIGGQVDDLWIIDADNPDTINTAAGKSPILYDAELTIDPETGHQILTIKIDEANPLYAADWNDTPTKWQDIEITLKYSGGKIIRDDITHGANVRPNPGYLKIDFGTSLDSGVEYEVWANDAAKGGVGAVYGVREDYQVDTVSEAGTVSYTANQLVIENLKVTNYNDGTAEWSIDEAVADKVLNYAVKVEKKVDDNWRGVIETTTTNLTYSIDATAGYDAGTIYRLTVQAMSGDAGYANSEPLSIGIYKLLDPSAASIDNATGNLSYTADENAIENTVELSDTNASYSAPKITFDMEADAHEVTATITSKGGSTKEMTVFDETLTTYILNATNTTTATAMAGLAPEIEFVDKTFHNNTDGKQYTEIKADATDDLYDALDWANFTVVAKEVATGNTYTGTIDAAAVTADGVATVVFSGITAAGDYEVTVTPAIATAYTAVAAAKEVAETCTYEINKLEVKDLAVVDNATGEATWTADPDKATSYEVKVEKKVDDNWRGVIETTTTDPEYLIDSTAGYEAGVLYKLTVTAISGDPDYAKSDAAEIQIYRLDDPTITEVAKNGKVKATIDETYASISDYDADNNATVDDETAIVTFDLTREAVEVTVTLESKGGYDSDAKVYVLDAENAATGTIVAGLMPEFKNATLTIDPETGNQILTLDIDTNNKLYSETYSETPEMWNQIKITAKGSPDSHTFNITHGANVMPNPGKIVINMGSALGEGEYDILIDDAVRSAWAKVAGVREQYSAGTVTNTAAAPLEIIDLAVVDPATGKATWSVSDDTNVAKYEVTVSTDAGGGWTKSYDVEPTSAEFTLSDDGINDYEAGTLYTLSVKAISSNAGVPGGEAASIQIYRLNDPTITEIARNGKVKATIDETYASTSDYEADNGATVDDATAIATFDLTREATTVTVTLNSKGGYDSDADVYVLDAENAATGTIVAGLMPEFKNATLTIDPVTGDQILTLDIDTANLLYAEAYADTPEQWNQIKITAKGASDSHTFNITHGANVRPNPGKIVVNMGSSLGEGDYDILIDDAARAAWVKVGGVREQYSAGKVTVAEPAALTITELKVADPATGEVTWTVAEGVENAASYSIRIEKKLDDTWTAVTTDPISVTDPTYTFTGYEEGIEYKFYVTAISAAPASYSDSAEASIAIKSVDKVAVPFFYGLFKSSDATVTTSGETLYFATVANATTYKVTVTDGNGGTKEFTVTDSIEPQAATGLDATAKYAYIDLHDAFEDGSEITRTHPITVTVVAVADADTNCINSSVSGVSNAEGFIASPIS